MISSRPLLACTLAILHSLPHLAAAAPPVELVVLQTQYEHAVAQRVTAVHEAAVGALNAKFTTALDNAIAQAKSAGDLTAVLAIQGDKKLLAEKQPLPAEDEQTPEALKKLRGIYRDQLAKLIGQRSANATALLTPYTARLKELEATLTKADRIAEAQEVLTYRGGLKADAPPVPQPAPAMTATAAPSTPEPTLPAKPARTFPPADDRKVAEWAHDYAWRINLKVTGEEKDRSVNQETPLPEAAYVIVGMDINLQAPPKKPFKNLETLAGLQNVRWLNLYNMDISDADCDIFASLPKLESLGFQKCRGKLTGSRFDLLASIPTFANLDLRSCAVTSNGIKAISSLKNLEKLSLTDTDTSDKDLPFLAGITSLQSLKLDLTRVSSKGFSALKPLVNLKGFGWSPTPRKAREELAALAAALPGIESFQLRVIGSLSAEDAAGLAAFPQLSQVYLEYETCTRQVLEGLSALPALKYVRCYYGETTTDDAFEPLTKSTTLETVEFDNMPKLTGVTLDHLGKIPSLKKITLSRCDKIDKAAVEAFKKARPQVTINK